MEIMKNIHPCCLPDCDYTDFHYTVSTTSLMWADFRVFCVKKDESRLWNWLLSINGWTWMIIGPHWMNQKLWLYTRPCDPDIIWWDNHGIRYVARIVNYLIRPCDSSNTNLSPLCNLKDRPMPRLWWQKVEFQPSKEHSFQILVAKIWVKWQ